MNVLWILAILFVVVTFIFIAIALLFPEWVGITGKVAKRIEAEQRGDAYLNELKDKEDKESPPTA